MTTIIKGDFSRRSKAGSDDDHEPAPIFQLKISLAFSDPLIWRRLLVPGEISLRQLHHILQHCMGWDDIHTHRFLVGKVFYGPSENGELWEQTGERDEATYRLAMLETDMKWCFTYVYDFGDGWEHEIELEQTLPNGQVRDLPTLLEGEKACPPENVGGIPGYEEFLTIINDPGHEHHQRMVNWYGAECFDPDFLNVEEIDKFLRTHSTFVRRPG
jgi:hypothetical protein